MKPNDTIYLGSRVDHVPHVMVGPSFLLLDTAPARDLTPCVLISFEWGYSGMGPLQLAAAILLDFLRGEEKAREMALRFNGLFMAEFVARWPEDGFTLYGAEIVDYLVRAGVKIPFEKAG